jgi:hypothetical protein
MSYDLKRTAKYAALTAGISYFGASLIEKVVQSTPVLNDDKYRMAGTAAVAVVAVDLAMQSGFL